MYELQLKVGCFLGCWVNYFDKVSDIFIYCREFDRQIHIVSIDKVYCHLVFTNTNILKFLLQVRSLDGGEV